MSPPARGWASTLLLAVAYYVVGRLALLLAIPPGYATAVWPAAGFALAGILLLGNRAWPGVWVGSFFVNVWTSFDATDALSILKSAALAANIGAGAALQAVVGAALVRRFVGYPNPLAREKDIIGFLVLGGPVACLVNPTIGVTGLWLGRAIEPADYGFSWWTWWVGDTIGALIFAPLILIWAVKPRARGLQSLRRQISVTLPLCLTFTLAVVVFVYATRWEQDQIRSNFERRIDDLAQKLTKDLDGGLEVLNAVESLYAAAPNVDRNGFHEFIAGLISLHPGIQALSWNPRIAQSARAEFEETARREIRGFEITERGEQGQVTRASARSEYVPVYFLEPYRRNQRALGFDLASDPLRRQALDRARDSGRATATPPLKLVQETEDPLGLLVFLPIYAPGLPHDSLEDRRTHLRGFCTAAFRIGDVVDVSLRDAEDSGIAIDVSDVTTLGAPILLHPRHPPGAGPAKEPDRRGQGASLRRMTVIEIAGRRWELGFSATPRYHVHHRSWAAWGVLAGGLLFTGLLGVLLLVITGRAVRIEELVAERTDELERANQELRRHIDEVKRAEEELERQARELARSNRELEQFAYVASHDLQEPLRMVGSYTELLAQRYPEKRDAETDEFIGYVLEGVMRMQALIRDLLSYSRVGSQAQPFVATDCGEVLQRALANLRSAIDDSGAEVTIGGLPVVGADPSQMLQLFQNLVGNAVKFHGEERPLIRVGAERRGADWVFSVTDNGIGIDARYADRIFVIFQRLHGRGKYPGTGIGLAICKKIVERHAGRIWVESQPGKGATFYFTIPAIPG